MKKLHALVLGATGATGQELVRLLLKHPNFSTVTIFVRKNVSIYHEKLIVHKIDFSKLNEYKDKVVGDILFSALGTTKNIAGSKKKQYLVDYTYQFEFAKIALENGVNSYSLVSSFGANKHSFFFYTRIKGDLEESVKSLNFKKIQIFQPPVLIRQPSLRRSNEKIAIKFLTVLNKIGVLKYLRPLSVLDLARRMLVEVLSVQNERISIYKPVDLYN